MTLKDDTPLSHTQAQFSQTPAMPHNEIKDLLSFNDDCSEENWSATHKEDK